jgi:hypothetical protein
MNVKVTTLLREACAAMPARGIQVVCGGAWYVWDSEKILGADPIGAAILVADKLPAGLDPKDPSTHVRPGLMEAACKLLDVDAGWLWRFWMGYDRNYQVMIVTEEKGKERKESLDEVSAFGMALRREILRYS